MYKTLSLVISLFLLTSCSSGKQAGTDSKSSKESVSSTASGVLEINPKEANRKTTLVLTANGFNLSEAKIEWLVNGRSFTTVVPTQFDGSDAAKGDSVQAKAVVAGREIRSNVVQIMNTPPQITRVKILPEVFKPGDTLSVEAEGNDIDGDSISYQYEWTKNGEPAGQTNRMETAVKRGDRISIKVTPFDGENHGTPAVLNREIRNLPPVIESDAVFTFDGKMYTYQVKATDPDGDALSYSLEGAPTDMTIDKSTGLISWPVPTQFKGEASAAAVVNDGNGGNARYNLKIRIK